MRLERRRVDRIQDSCEVQYRPAGEVAEVWRMAHAINASAAGVRLRGEEPLQPGTLLDLHITPLTSKNPLALQGRVIWNQMHASGVNEHGVEFVQVTPTEQGLLDQMMESMRKAR